MKYVLCLLFLFSTIQNTQAQTNNNKPIPWEYIKPEDMLWKKRVWRQIDLLEKNNAPMSNDSLIPKEYVFANILLRGLKSGTIKAYTDEDTSFKDPLPVQKVDSIIQCGQECIYPGQVAYYQIAEDWIFNRKAGQLTARIWTIAPAANVNGSIKPLFWVYYPDCRNLFAQYEVFNPHDDIARYTWDEYFESRQFSSKITKLSDPFLRERFKKNAQPMESIYDTNPFEDNSKGKKHKRKKRKVRNKDGVWVY